MSNSKPASVNQVWLVSLAALAVSVAVVGMNLMGQGHAAFNTTSHGPLAWGMPVVTYDYFVSFSIGMAFVAGAALVFDVEGLYASMKRVLWIAMAALAGGILVLGLELGHPFRATYAILLNFQTSSPLFWKPILVFLYIWVLLAAYAKVARPGWSPAAVKPLGYALFITGGLLAAGSAAVFGLMSMRPVWYDPMLPVFSIFESMILGLSGIIVAVSIGHGGVANAPEPTRKLLEGLGRNGMALFTAVVLLSVVVRAWGGVWSNLDGLQVWQTIVRGPLFWAEIVALALALALLLRGGGLLSAAVLVIVATFIGRYEFVIAGQMVPLFKGSWVPGLVSYAPSITEWMVAVLGLALNFAIYAYGEKRLDLSAAPGN
ncbi:MAG: polysulfide reductase NrfD [Rhodocyclaceae bacterium]|nr:polysulfide reductase NrfD [Rhodocyclaceae bacterium]